VKVLISARAQREFERCNRWWREHRDAKGLLIQEMLDVIDRVALEPEAGTLYEAACFDSPVRRVLLPKTGHHLYHSRIGDTVTIVAVWSARRGRGPRL
jgi:plasmid stabilization system protein ParE